MIIRIIIAIICSYLLGCIPTSFIFGKLIKKIDIRQFGSHNVGATNAIRVLGVKIGIITLLIDIAKGFFAIHIGKMIIQNPDNILIICLGLSAILGHIFTVFLNFKGGKGVATSAGVLITLAPIPFLIAFFTFVLIVWITKYVSLGSILAGVVLLIVEIIINIRNSFSDLEFLIFFFIVVLFIIIRHKKNIIRLFSGTENKISFKKKQDL